MADIRTISEEWANIGNDVISSEEELNDVRFSKVSIVYLTSEHKKTKNGEIVCAQCEKVADKYKWAIPADYTVTVFLPNVEGFSDTQKYALMFHELLHIDIGMKDDGSETYSIKDHDLKDFKVIIDRYGVAWNVPNAVTEDDMSKSRERIGDD